MNRWHVVLLCEALCGGPALTSAVLSHSLRSVCVFNGCWLHDISAALWSDLALNKSFSAASSAERPQQTRIIWKCSCWSETVWILTHFRNTIHLGFLTFEECQRTTNPSNIHVKCVLSDNQPSRETWNHANSPPHLCMQQCLVFFALSGGENWFDDVKRSYWMMLPTRFNRLSDQ